MILLDTCTFLWIVSDPDKLSEEAKKMIAKHSESLFVAAISAFEIGVKVRRGHLQLPFEMGRWFEASLQFHGIDEIPLNSEIAIRSTQLPLHHRDPCDRIIIATSQIHDLVLLTPDPLIHQYSGFKIVW